MSRIVVVDDNPLNNKRSESLLQPLGHEVISFTGAEPALQLLKTHPVHLILVDLAMPIHSGYDLMAAIKKERIDVKIVVVSGKNKDEDVKKAMALGAQDYILKPYDDDFFVAKVKQALPSEGTGADPHFAEAVYDKPIQFRLSIPQITLSETGFYFDSQVHYPKGMILELKSEIFDSFKINDSRFRVTTCSPIKNSPDGLYRTFVSFVGLSQSQLSEVRLWVRQQSIKFRKS